MLNMHPSTIEVPVLAMKIWKERKLDDTGGLFQQVEVRVLW